VPASERATPFQQILFLEFHFAAPAVKMENDRMTNAIPTTCQEIAPARHGRRRFRHGQPVRNLPDNRSQNPPIP
jgi:hypothetical protein